MTPTIELVPQVSGKRSEIIGQLYKLDTQGHSWWRCSEVYAPANRMMGINEHPEPAITRDLPRPPHTAATEYY